jgi:phage terminase small subunit
MATERKLTPKQERFIQEYLIDCNATGAARRAGYSEKAAEQVGFDNLRKPWIAEEIQKAQAKLAKKAEITQEWVVGKLKKIAETCSDEDSEKWNPPAANKSIELLGKHLGMFTDKVDVTSGGKPLETAVNIYLPDNGRDTETAERAAGTVPEQSG